MKKYIVKSFFGVLFLFCASSLMGASYSYWQNGWRKNSNAKVDDILVIETPSYLFSLNTKDLSYSHFVPQKDDFIYGGQKVVFKDISKQKKTPLELSVSVGEDKYVANLSKAGKFDTARPLQDVLLWESGSYVQHYDFKDVEFYNSKGNILDIYADLKLCAWQNHFALSLNVENALVPSAGYIEGVSKAGYCIEGEKITIPAKEVQMSEAFSVAIWINTPKKYFQASNRKGIVFISNKNASVDGAWGIKVDDIYNFSAFMKASDSYETAAFKAKDGWNLLVMSYGDKELKLYANGKLVGKAVDIKKPLSVKPADITLGARGDKNGEVCSIYIDEFKIWDRVLSDTEIKALYKEPSETLASDNVIFEKNFDEGKFGTKENKLKNVKLGISLGDRKVQKSLDSVFKEGDVASLTLPVFIKDMAEAGIEISKEGVSYPVEFSEQKQCYVATVEKEKRAEGFVNACNYEDFNLTVKGGDSVPFLLHLKSPASITGLCPILCNKDGSPTGIAVQLSKNWHERKMGSYMMAYTQVPQGEYILRIVYGFYGKYPSASHSNLSLVGYGGSGRWEQLAIGAWGETICFDADNSLVTNWITDIRMLMARDGKDGKMWGWTDAGWGGDWLNIKTKEQARLMPVGLKTSYVSQGPCLTDVRYDGFLGEGREVSMRSQIQTLRTNDYARIFQRVEYVFNKDVKAEKISIYNLRNMTGVLAMGNKTGLARTYDTKQNAKPSTGFTKFDFGVGGYPLYFAAIGKDSVKKGAAGYKAIVIRDFEAKVGTKSIKEPMISYDAKAKSIDLLFEDGNIKNFKKGDRIFFDIELCTLHANADDYYGDNEEYIKHLQENPLSYKTIMREALGNDLKVSLKGGEILRKYPVEIEAKSSVVEIEIEGGVGLVPLKISNLASKNFALYEVLADGKLEKFDDSVKGNDFFQVNYNELRNTYSLVYNLPLSGKKAKYLLK